MSDDLRSQFDHAKTQADVSETLEQIRHHFSVTLKMHGSDDATMGGLNINTSGRTDSVILSKDKQRRATYDMIFMAMLDQQLEMIERAMIKKYGEDFAEQFAAELLDEETFNALMQIKDPEERRQAFADAINEGVRNGTIDAEHAFRNPDYKEWLHARSITQDRRNNLEHSHANISDGLEADHSHEFSNGFDEETVFDTTFAKADIFNP